MQYIPRIDTFRAFAAFSVVYYHYFGPLVPAWAKIAPHGVQFFFVLSGFLIATLLLREQDRGTPVGQHLASFYIRRVFRIFPLYFAVLLAGAMIGLHGFRESWPWTATFTTNIMICHDFGEAGYYGPAWTIAVEEQFYLVAPLVLLILPRAVAVNLAVVTVLVAIGYRMAVFSQFLPPSCLVSTFAQADHLAVGVLAAAAVHHFGVDRVERWLRSTLWFTLPCLALGFAIRMIPQWWGPVSLTLPITVGSVGAAWLIVRAVKDGPHASSWGGALLPALGSISYAVYLIHNPMLAFTHWLEQGVPSFWPRVLAFVLTVAVAVVSRFLLEKPMIDLGRRLARGYTKVTMPRIMAGNRITRDDQASSPRVMHHRRPSAANAASTGRGEQD